MNEKLRNKIIKWDREGAPFLSLLMDDPRYEQLEMAVMEYDEDERYWKDYEKEWRRGMMSDLIQFKSEMRDTDFARSARTRWYDGQQEEIYTQYTQESDVAKKALLEKQIRDIEKKRAGRIDDLMIAQAKDYPIDQIVEVKRGFALCPGHEDTKPSMDCRGGFVHCYACGYNGDTIKLYQDVNGVSFIEAVKSMT